MTSPKDSDQFCRCDRHVTRFPANTLWRMWEKMQVIRMLPPHLNTTNSQGTNNKHVANSQRTQYICNNTRETSNKHFTNTQRTQQTGNSTNSRSRLFFSTIRNPQPLRCSSFRPEKSLKYISLQLLKEKFVTNEKIQLFVLCFSNVLLGP